MSTLQRTVVFSLGGSLIYPLAIDIAFLKKFKCVIMKFIKRGNTAIIVVGGGAIARQYNMAACTLHPDVKSSELDWMGIKATKVNAELVRIMFNTSAYYKVLDDPTKIPSKGKKQIYVSGGWKPGASSDHVAVQLALTFGAGSVVNLTNIDRVYTKDPRYHLDAEPLDYVSWKEFIRIVGTKWDPGANTPFDPIASKLAARRGLEVVILNGSQLANVERFLYGNKFTGTIIAP